MKHDAVSSPDHYTLGGIEVIDILEAKLTHAEFVGFLKGNCIKYMMRMGYKEGSSWTIDLGKCQWYLEKLSHTLSKKNSPNLTNA